ncbi:MAG: PaaI family thioesterase [Candidatus Omnitrophica bacterium]|nr:PaaI family thioesterase [Candidatus Omnitrophota bacterium]
MRKTIKTHLKPLGSRYAPVMSLIGMRVVKISKGRATLALKAKRRHLNTIGSVHGGILCDLSDAAMGSAFASLVGGGRVGVTVEFKINFLKPVFASDEVRASAKVISHGNSLYFTECELRSGKNHLVAKASGTCKILK